MLITSLTNPKVKAAVKLRDRHGRDEQERIIIDGQREIRRALDGSVRIEALFVCEELLAVEQAKLVDRALAAGAVRIDVTSAVMEKLAFGQRVEGVVAVAETPRRSLADIGHHAAQARLPLIAVLEGIEKPGNVGAVLRTADAAGVCGMIIADGGTDLYNPNAIRASLGAVFTVPLCAATSDQTLSWLRQGTWQIVAARVDGTIPYTRIDFRQPTAIILGSEAHGLSHHWQSEGIAAISLPMLGSVDSLNVSATAAVLFYEALRQRS